MEKKLLLTLFFWAIYWLYPSIFANNGLLFNHTPNRLEVYCDAPAPDNFQVTSRGADFIAVAWDAIAAGVTYSLVVSILDNGTWIPLDTFSHIQESSFVVHDIGFDDEVLLALATECSSGERSILQVELLPKIILELSVPGRVPVNPQTVEPCKNINLGDHDWVGFSVKKHGGSLLESNVFEVVVTEKFDAVHIDVERNSSQTVIFAADNEPFWPPPTIKAPNPFLVIDNSNPSLPYSIGRVFIGVTLKPELEVSICNVNSQVWDDNYDFKVLVADLSSDPSPESPTEHSSKFEGNKTIGNLKAISPFSENLLVFFEEPIKLKKDAIITLVNTSGQIVLENKITLPFDQISIPTASIPSGIYALRIMTDNKTQAIKVQKVD